MQTAGEALNYHPHLHGLLADSYWKDGVFTTFAEADLKAIDEAFAERVLAQLHKRELITDDDVAQILSQDHTGFGVWLGDPFHDKESGSSLRATLNELYYPSRSLQSKMTSLPMPLRKAQLLSLTLWIFSLNSHLPSAKPTKVSHDTTDGIPADAEVNTPSSIFLQLKNTRATIEESSVRVDGPRA